MAPSALRANSDSINLRDISQAFGGVPVVYKVSLSTCPGAVVALRGRNGAGKSTLMKMRAGAYPIDSGQVIVSGQAVCIIYPADSHKLGIESIYQTLALADTLDRVANLFLGCCGCLPTEANGAPGAA